MVLTDGRVILVDRGWVPENRRDPATRAEGQPEGQVTLEGLLRTGGWKGLDFARPPNEPEERFYFWLDLPVMAENVSEGPVITEVYVDAAASEIHGGLPVGGQTRRPDERRVGKECVSTCSFRWQPDLSKNKTKII